MRIPIEARFWRKVNKSGPLPDPEKYPNVMGRCWLWTAGVFRDGYGKIRKTTDVDSKSKRAHRVSWEMHNGEIPEGMWVLHHCDNTRCVNPEHLFLGTHQDNEDDKIKKGRHVAGERNGRAKVNPLQVRIMRRLSEGGMTCVQIAKIFSVKVGVAECIARRATWKHL